MEQTRIRPLEWEFNIGDHFHCDVWGVNLRLIDIEEGIGRFVPVKDGKLVNGAAIEVLPLDQFYLQMLHMSRINRGWEG